MSAQELHNAKLLEILDEFLRVCQEYNLKYYLAYGTCLGAVRHKGMIPWDDDIDVLMPRRDLEKLYTMRNAVFGKDFKMVSYRDDKNHLYCMMKLESLTSTLIEHVNPIYVGGIYIDLFPLDNVPSEAVDAVVTKEVCTFNCDYGQYSVCPPPQTYFIKYLFYLYRRKKWLQKNELQRWDDMLIPYMNEDTEWVKDYHNDWPHRGLFKREVFGEGVVMDFEGRKCRVPTNYDAFLRESYGEYMQLPPAEKRIYKHEYLFENPTRRLNDEELKPILKKIKFNHSYHFCLLKDLKMILNKINRLVHLCSIK